MNLYEKIIFEFRDIINEANDKASDRLKFANNTQKYDIKAIKKYFNDIFKNQEIKSTGSKDGEDKRIKVGERPDINGLWFKDHLDSSTISVTEVLTILPGESDARSKQLPTIKITAASGAKVYYVLSGAGGSVGRKQLTPNAFGVEGVSTDVDTLYNRLTSKLAYMKLNDDIKDYLFHLLECAYNGDITANTNKRVIVSKNITDDNLKYKIEPVDKAMLQNDFGEILGAVVMGRVKNEDILFPKSANAPLTDYEVGDFRYSAKSIDGAAPTLTPIANEFYDFTRNEMPNSKLNSIFEALYDSGLRVYQIYLTILKAVYPEGWEAFLKCLELQDFDCSDTNAGNKINKILDGHLEAGILEDKLKAFYSAIKTTPKTSIDEYDINNGSRYGFITGAVSYGVPKVLNKDTQILSDLKKVLNQLNDVRQINMYNKNGALEFALTDFMDDNIKIKFMGGGSARKPNMANLRFKIIV